MKKNPKNLNEKFTHYVMRHWNMNDHNLKDISCVYIIISLDFFNGKKADIAYVGSTTKLFSRYKSHRVPKKIQDEGGVNILYFLPMKKGFYDYEIKLIRKLQPRFNYQHRGNN